MTRCGYCRRKVEMRETPRGRRYCPECACVVAGDRRETPHQPHDLAQL